MSQENQTITRQEREWRARHEEILAAATDLFAEHGYAGTTMQMIADAAEFSVGYLYKHFPGKEELLEQIVTREMEAFHAMRARVREEYRARPLAQIRETLAQSSAFLKRHAALTAFLFQESNSVLEKVKRRMGEYRQEDVDTIQLAMDRGELVSGDAALLTATLDGVVWGLVRVMTETGQTELYEDIPRVVEELLLAPLIIDATANKGKDLSS